MQLLLCCWAVAFLALARSNGPESAVQELQVKLDQAHEQLRRHAEFRRGLPKMLKRDIALASQAPSSLLCDSDNKCMTPNEELGGGGGVTLGERSTLQWGATDLDSTLHSGSCDTPMSTKAKCQTAAAAMGLTWGGSGISTRAPGCMWKQSNHKAPHAESLSVPLKLVAGILQHR